MLKKLIIAVVLACSACMPAQEAKADTTVVEYAPCAPPVTRVETVVVRPGYVWVTGHWYWSSARWVWVPGRHIVARVGYRWIAPRYTYVGRRWVFVRGRWIR